MTDRRELRLRERIDTLIEERDELRQRCLELERLADKWYRRYKRRPTSPAWTKRREVENGRKRLSPCAECGAVTRGVRCRSCYYRMAKAATCSP